jgi:Endoglucanase Y
MKRIAGITIILVVFVYISVYLTFLSMPVADVFNDAVPAFIPAENNTSGDRIFSFINKNLLKDDGGILTNIGNYKGGKDTLSESVGLLMNYCVISGNRELFDREYEFLKKKMLTDKGFIKWRVGSDNTVCNASIDDMRIICALLDAYDSWGDNKYYNLAGDLQLNLYKYQAKDHNLFQLYDWKTGKSSHTTPLCYLDFYTLYRMGTFNENWYAVEERAASIIMNGRINASSPFFYKNYDYDTGRYSMDEEYDAGKGICLTYSIYTALHLAEVNEDTGFFTDWLKMQIKSGPLYAWYDPTTLKNTNNIESTAVYALAAVYADKTGEKELCGKLMDNMYRFMVTDKKSKYYGGFGNPASKCFYSFDNLTALWATSIAK